MLIGLKDKKKRSPSLLFAFQEFFRQKKRKNRKKIDFSGFHILYLWRENSNHRFEFWRPRMIEILKCNKLPINWRFPSINLSNCCLLLKIANAAVTYFEDQLYHQRIVKHSSFYIVLWFLNKSEVWKFLKKSHLINIECGVFEFSRKIKKIGNFFGMKIPR